MKNKDGLVLFDVRTLNHTKWKYCVLYVIFWIQTQEHFSEWYISSVCYLKLGLTTWKSCLPCLLFCFRLPCYRYGVSITV